MPKLSIAQQEEALSLLCKVVGQIPCFHVFEKLISSDLYEKNIYLHALIKNAMLDSALVNIRAFDEFFIDGGRADDIRFGDFSEQKVGGFLDKSERSEIDKHLAHITTLRLEGRKSWLVDRLAGKALFHAIEFFRMALEVFPFSDSAVKAEVSAVKAASEEIIKLITSLNRGEEENP